LGSALNAAWVVAIRERSLTFLSFISRQRVDRSKQARQSLVGFRIEVQRHKDCLRPWRYAGRATRKRVVAGLLP
jgi:hypothetical protein